MNVRLHIERLVVEGVPLGPGGGARLQAAVEQELTRLLTRDGLNPALTNAGAILRLPAPSIQLDGGNKPAELGRRIARAVHGGIGK
jgi:hypothetical protein